METPQVVKLAWEKGFALGQITSYRTYRDGMRLFRFKKPQSYKGKLFRWVIDYGEFDDSGKLLRLRQRLWLLVKTEAEAQAKFKEVDAAKRAYDDRMKRLQRSYCDMKRSDLADAVHKATGHCFGPDAIAKRAERLGLATTPKVRPGPRPRVEA